MGSPLVMRNPRKGHAIPFAKTLASGLLFCHVGNCQVANTANQNLKGRPAFERVFLFLGCLFPSVRAVKERRRRGNRHADSKPASIA
jgi:hypothetical protein